MLLAEGQSLDGLILVVQLFFAGTALPGALGWLFYRLERGGRIVAFCLGLLSVLAGACCLGWVVWERSTLPSFYLAASTPLLVGMETCLLAWRARKKVAPPS